MFVAFTSLAATRGKHRGPWHNKCLQHCLTWYWNIVGNNWLKRSIKLQRTGFHSFTWFHQSVFQQTIPTFSCMVMMFFSNRIYWNPDVFFDFLFVFLKSNFPTSCPSQSFQFMNNHQVGRISQRLETCCNLLYPPLAPLFLRWQRNRRARRVVEALNEFCEAERLWTWIREPGLVGSVWIGDDGRWLKRYVERFRKWPCRDWEATKMPEFLIHFLELMRFL